jgi:hypothetical protein
MERTKIDFAALKSGIAIDAVLTHYGVQTKKRNSQYLVAECPLPSHTSKESPLSFAINVEKNLWTCHSDSCKKASGMKGGDVIDLVCLIEGTKLPLEGARRLVEWFPHLTGNGGEARPAGIPLIEKNKPLAFTLKDVNPEHPMIQSRGIAVATAKEFGVGFFPGKGSMAGRIVFPLYEQLRSNGDGTSQVALVGYAGRLVAEPTAENPKWKLPPVHKSFLYGLEKTWNPGKLLILAESFWAPLYYWERGAQCASLMGKALTEGQEKQLERFHDICVALDNDEAGREAAEKICARLKMRHRVMRAFLMEG